MKNIFEVSVVVPTSWNPPFVEFDTEESEQPLQFKLVRSWLELDSDIGNRWAFTCLGCSSAGGEIEDIFRTSSFVLDDGGSTYWGKEIPTPVRHEMYEHGRQHEIIWRWAYNRISAKTTCR